MNKLLVICGPTATGKTQLGIELAKKFNGEIISADSRQVYKGMDIGTGKDIPQKSKIKNQKSKLHIKNKKFTVGYREKEGIPVWLVDICNPDYAFNVGEYVALAHLAIEDIQKRGRLPIVVGGTGFYIKGIIEPFSTISIPPHMRLRKKLETLTLEKLQEKLQELDISKWHTMNHSDRHNPRRLIRAIEVAEWKTKRGGQGELRKEHNDILWLGLTIPQEELFKRIDERVEKRVKQGILKEIQNLLSNGYTFKYQALNTIGYKEWIEYFEHKKSSKEIIQQWKLDEHDYARRQITWFKKMPGIQWFDISSPSCQNDIQRLVNGWYTSNR